MGKKGDDESNPSTNRIYNENEVPMKHPGSDTASLHSDKKKLINEESEESLKLPKSSTPNDNDEKQKVPNLDDEEKPTNKARQKYKMLLSSLPFDEDEKLENHIKSQTQISAFELMFECCLKLKARNKARYEIIGKCKDIVEKYMNVEYMIHKQIEMNFLKNYILNNNDYQMFKYHFKSLNFSNVDETMQYLKFLKKENLKPVTKDVLVQQVMTGHKKMLDAFYEYHVI